MKRTCTHPGCRAFALKDGLLCFVHDDRPETVAKRNLARSKGGKSHHPYHGDVIEGAIEDACATLKQLREQLATKKKVTASDAKAATSLLSAIVYGKESAVLKRLKDAKTKNSTA